jgi:CotS family spore coat protein
MSFKEFMPVDEIRNKILSKYPYIIYDITPIKFKDTDKQRAVYRFESNAGPKCLKKVYYDKENLLFVYSVIEWLYQSGINVPRLLPTLSGGRFVKYKNNLFIVTDWVEGRKCDYDMDEDVCAAAENLGKMHKSSYGFKPIRGSAIRWEDPDWYKTFCKRFLQLLQFSNTAYKVKDNFSSIYLDNFEYNFVKAKHSIEVLNGIELERLSEPLKKYNTVCHLDYVNKNLILTDQGSVCVIDFDKSRNDMPVHDIGTFLKRILKRKNTSWDFSILIKTIENYEKQRRLSLIEHTALFAYLEFPQKYWKVSRDYYNNRGQCNKDMYISMLEKTCQQQEEHNEFCRMFQDYVEQKFKISLK